MAAAVVHEPMLAARAHLAEMHADEGSSATLEHVLGFARQAFTNVTMFALRNACAQGWRSSEACQEPQLRQIAVPLKLPSALQTLYATGGMYLGPLENSDVHQRMFAALQRQMPVTACLLPVVVRGKTVAIVMADDGQVAVSTTQAAALSLVVQHAGVVLDQCLQQQSAS